jgi:hypothetical protein
VAQHRIRKLVEGVKGETTSVMGVVDLPSGQSSIGSNNGDSSAGEGATGGAVSKGRTCGIIGCCCIR